MVPRFSCFDLGMTLVKNKEFRQSQNMKLKASVLAIKKRNMKFRFFTLLTAALFSLNAVNLDVAFGADKNSSEKKSDVISKKQTKATVKKVKAKQTQSISKNKIKANKKIIGASAAGLAGAGAVAGVAASNPSQDKNSSVITTIPTEISHAMRRAKVSPADISIAAIPLDNSGPTLQINANTPRIPASVEKIVTSAAALDLLGPSKVWATKIAVEEETPIENGVLKGDLFIIGGGDPYLPIERFWLLLDNLKARGVKHIEGNIVIDRTLYNVPKHNQFAFDGDGYRPYNLGPDAFLLNSRSLIIKFKPDKEKGVAYLYPEPALHNIKLPESIPLSKAPCGAWRKQIAPDYSDPSKPVFNGKYPLACGVKHMLYTVFGMNDYVQAVFSGLWNQDGKTFKGKVVSGKAPDKTEILAVTYSQPLAQINYNMNKYSNNLIARQLFLALGKTAKEEPKSLQSSRATMRNWADKLGISPRELYVDNGSGLSRTSQLSADAACKILRYMWNHKNMPEFISALPISGTDGTMRKRKVASGQAHIKTGYISGVRSIAGYVQTATGHRYAVSAIVNGSSAIGAVPVMDSIISWIYNEC